MKDFQKELGKELLASVSRSFFLSLRFLPPKMRESTSLAYLLARISDTIADTEALPKEKRLIFLSEIGSAIQGSGSFPDLSDMTFGEGLTEGESVLLQKSNLCLEWLEGIDDINLSSIQKVMRSIIKGQSDDLRRFSSNHLQCLSSKEELDDYTYDVAGSVGVFWTEIGFNSYGNKFSDQEIETMTELGSDYGKALQLLNILRDFPQDFDNGRCYFPGHFNGSSSQKVWEEVSEIWISRCRFLMNSAAKYVELLSSPRVRFSTGLPAMIGVQTLDLIEKSDWDSFRTGLKIKRSNVKSLMFRALILSLTKKGISNWLTKEIKAN